MKDKKIIEADELTGPGIGTSNTGHVPGGGALGGTGELTSGLPSGGTTDTDTGLSFGIGQSTSTGTLPTQGGSNLDGTDPDGNLQTDSKYGDHAPVGHINEYGDARDEADRKARTDQS